MGWRAGKAWWAGTSPVGFPGFSPSLPFCMENNWVTGPHNYSDPVRPLALFRKPPPPHCMYHVRTMFQVQPCSPHIEKQPPPPWRCSPGVGSAQRTLLPGLANRGLPIHPLFLVVFVGLRIFVSICYLSCLFFKLPTSRRLAFCWHYRDLLGSVGICQILNTEGGVPTTTGK